MLGLIAFRRPPDSSSLPIWNDRNFAEGGRERGPEMALSPFPARGGRGGEGNVSSTTIWFFRGGRGLFPVRGWEQEVTSFTGF